jgi:chorismate synthase
MLDSNAFGALPFHCGAPCPATRLGTLFCVTSFGESHGPAIGCVVDGCPPGLALAPPTSSATSTGASPARPRHVTQRRESDTVEILSGVFEGRTTGTPIALLIATKIREARITRRSRTRSPGTRRLRVLAEVRHPRLSRRRPRFGARNRRARGGGRNRAQVAGRASRRAHPRPSRAARPNAIPFEDWAHVDANPFFVANATIVAELEAFMDALRKSGDSCGAKITVEASGVPGGLGRARLRPPRCRSRAGDDGHQCGERRRDRRRLRKRRAARQRALRRDDARRVPVEQRRRNPGRHHDRDRTFVVTIAVKPTSSIRLDRRSIDKAGRPVVVNTHGRHDPCVGIRATPIAEAMLALVLMDHALRHRAQNADVVTTTPKLARECRVRCWPRCAELPPSTIRIRPKPRAVLRSSGERRRFDGVRAPDSAAFFYSRRTIFAPAVPRPKATSTSSPAFSVAAS